MEVVQSIGYIKFMDLLSKRYASPFFVLDEFIQLGQLYDFIVEVFQAIHKEEVEQIQWEYYLHKVFDKSYQEYLEDIERNKEPEPMQEFKIRNVVDDSFALLDLFNQ